MKSKNLNIIIIFLFLMGCSITCFSQSEFQPSGVNEKFFEANNLYNDLHNRGILSNGMQNGDPSVYPDELKEIMDTLFPLPPHTNSTRKTAATRIQKTVRGMMNRKKVSEMKTPKRKKSPQ